ncbi:MAG: hypothetical protein R2991_14390 [Thermoanaerobaculia bacterium]
MTLKAVVAGIVFGIVFERRTPTWPPGRTDDLTSIPVAVITAAAFRLLGRSGVESSLFEANISQTVARPRARWRAGSSLTLPALFLWHLDPSLLQMTLLALCEACWASSSYVAAPLPHRQGTRLPAVPRGDGLRRGAGRQRGRRQGPARFRGLAVGAFFQVPRRLAQGLRAS